MSSRQEEKQRRREERQARETAEKAAAARRQRLQLALGGVGGLAVIAVVVLLVTGAIGGDDGGGGDDGTASTASNGELASVELPPQEIGDLAAAADAAGCEVQNPEIEGSQHEERSFSPEDYKTNPPTSGVHFPDWSEDGVYAPGNTPELGMLVHTLEHGRINIQYATGTPQETVDQLESLYQEMSDGYHLLLYENPTEMDAAVAATAWGHSLTCAEMNDQVFDAIRTFRTRWIDKGPERVP